MLLCNIAFESTADCWLGGCTPTPPLTPIEFTPGSKYFEFLQLDMLINAEYIRVHTCNVKVPELLGTSNSVKHPVCELSKGLKLQQH